MCIDTCCHVLVPNFQITRHPGLFVRDESFNILGVEN
jgi:hypothetical protein